MLLSEVDPFEGSLRQARPSDELAAAKWDLDLGHSYRQMVKTAAWLHLVENLRRFREEAVQRLVDGEDGAGEWRQAIKTIDAVLKVPNAMTETAEDAKAYLEMVRQSNG